MAVNTLVKVVINRKYYIFVFLKSALDYYGFHTAL